MAQKLPDNLSRQDQLANSSIPATGLFEFFIPGYEQAYKFFLVTFHINITVFVAIFITFWIAYKFCYHTYTVASFLIEKYYTVTVDLAHYDKLIRLALEEWLLNNSDMKKSRFWEVKLAEENDGKCDRTDDEVYISTTKPTARARLALGFGMHSFYFRGTLITFYRGHSTLFGGEVFTRQENLKLSYIRHLFKPLRDFI